MNKCLPKAGGSAERKRDSVQPKKNEGSLKLPYSWIHKGVR
jgi:hypothetical protein